MVPRSVCQRSVYGITRAPAVVVLTVNPLPDVQLLGSPQVRVVVGQWALLGVVRHQHFGLLDLAGFLVFAGDFLGCLDGVACTHPRGAACEDARDVRVRQVEQSQGLVDGRPPYARAPGKLTLGNSVVRVDAPAVVHTQQCRNAVPVQFFYPYCFIEERVLYHTDVLFAPLWPNRNNLLRLGTPGPLVRDDRRLCRLCNGRYCVRAGCRWYWCNRGDGGLCRSSLSRCATCCTGSSRRRACCWCILRYRIDLLQCFLDLAHGAYGQVVDLPVIFLGTEHVEGLLELGVQPDALLSLNAVARCFFLEAVIRFHVGPHLGLMLLQGARGWWVCRAPRVVGVPRL